MMGMCVCVCVLIIFVDFEASVVSLLLTTDVRFFIQEWKSLMISQLIIPKLNEKQKQSEK